MNIGQVSKQSGISSKMIRYYEEIGLIDVAKRSDAGYRIYTEQDLKTLNFIKHARDLGFSSEQMKELISLWKNTGRTSAEVKQLASKHIEALNQKIKTLQEMVDTLQDSVVSCSGDSSSNCTILKHIEHGADIR
ncbi:Cu(I)-responsive transcriptional regulator [Acinetobacter sp. ANC 4648]|uniref:Cu(I)-responsive transcriptional regulator n=1 Tax=Acinetobacter sp. ANC 4648 TaxID=1977875 RepID=UPI000A347C2C|nr:Cu(I)-responsive transcriptional regulator [Acinetobacter sp. ANC 4648]OTG80348.1 Cu(I)-responsive transcriptional regulator [Acinetobacter sp. ANC 4648]